jgi:DNA-binding GntR family transcriptional regulator
MDFAHAQVSIETSFCSNWEAEQLQIPVRGAVFVTLCTEFRRQGAKTQPCEVVRGVYRVDRVQLRFEVPASGEVPAALWQISK